MQNEDLKKNAPIFWPWGVFLFAVLISADLFFKHLAKNTFRNYLFAFSLPVPERFIYLIYAIVLGAIVYHTIKNYNFFSFPEKLAWMLIFAGAILNITERIILGYVRDFIYITFYKWTGIYNLADMYILLGVLILFFGSKKHSK